MIAQLNRIELMQALSGAWHVDVTDLVITPTIPSEVGDTIRKSVKAFGTEGMKLSNCRALRSVADELGTPMNLPDTKWALENWAKFLEFADVFNRLPVDGYGSTDSKGILR